MRDSSCRRLTVAIVAMAGVISVLCSARAASERTDFVREGSDASNRWDLTQTLYDDKHGRKFTNGGETLTSEAYPAAVVAVTVSARMFGSGIAGSGSALTIEAAAAGSAAWREVASLVFCSGAATNETVTLSRADNFVRFRLTFVKGNGTLRVGAFEATWRLPGETAPPFDLAADAVGTNAFVATWRIDEPVDSFLFDCWTVTNAPWTGQRVWAESFAACANDGGSPRDFTAAAADWPGWRGERVYVPPRVAGCIQIGTAKDGGMLLSPALPAAINATVLLRAAAQKSGHAGVMTVSVVRADATNALAAVELTDELRECPLPIRTFAAGDRLLFSALQSGDQRRVLLDTVTLVGDYVPGFPVTNVVSAACAVPPSSATRFSVWGLKPGTTYSFAVRAVRAGVSSRPAGPFSVRTREPVVRPVVALSSLPRVRGRRMWREDFTAAGDLFSDGNTAAWTAGKTLVPWQLLRGSTPPDTFTRNTGGATATGFYFYQATNGVPASGALGTMTGASAEDLVCGVSFRNDTDFPLASVSLQFDGVQFGFKNKAPQEVFCEYALSDGSVPLAEAAGWSRVEGAVFRTTKDVSSGLKSGKDLPVVTAVSAQEIAVDLPPGGCFHVRWRRPPAATGAAMAIDNVQLVLTPRQRAFALVIR
jgi:hypothetical protein